MKLFTMYTTLVLGQPRMVLAGLALVVMLSAWFATDFRLDASADSLVVEGDPDLIFAREVGKKFGTGDFVFVVYIPEGELFSPEVLADLRQLRDALQALERIGSVDSIFGMPLFKVAGATLSDVAENILTLEEGGIDLDEARSDLLGNKAYRDVLLNADGSTTALIVNFAPNTTLQELTDRREELRQLRLEGKLDRDATATLADVERDYTRVHKASSADLHQDISAIREILDRHRNMAEIHMGGVPMIADDLVTFVKRDLTTFGAAIVLFIIAALWFFFRNWRLVAIPLICGASITVVVVGLLGLLDWPVTVISSNFMSLLLIITVSLTVHLIVRYRELQLESPGESHHNRLKFVLQNMGIPCAYTSLTTMVAFGSLAISDIPPVVDFGLMMVMGVFCAFIMSFLLFPALMAMIGEIDLPVESHAFDITPKVGRFTEKHRKSILFISFILLLASVAGISKLKVENSFIDYFDEDSEIHRGMLVIDRQMGGTTPLDVIVKLGRPSNDVQGFGELSDVWNDEWDDDWDEEGEASGQSGAEAAWFTSDKMSTIKHMHAWLDGLDETGKVLSLATLLDLAEELNEGRELNSFELGILYSRIPDAYRDSLLKPYVSVADDEVRFSIRIRESDPSLQRTLLLRKIESGLMENFGLAPEQVRLTGMLVLYNNMLLSLFESQIGTISVVMALIFLMFVILFRSFSLAILGIIPNLLAASSVIGLMGLAGIPLDMMTITIAAIAIGIGVDNTIHYIHRFRKNFAQSGNYLHTMHQCHGSIGKAMYYTSFTIIAGFSILVLSSFVPTVYFGMLTSLAMLLALAGALTLLPLLLVLCKPLGKEAGLR